MATSKSAIEEAIDCINSKKSFVMQGGAGSGKTETLKELLEYLSTNHPTKKVVCITHTNLAVNEIKSRVGDSYLVNTIHSFLYEVIKDYKKNIKEVIGTLFLLPLMNRNCFIDGMNEKEFKKEEHTKYTKLHDKYRATLFSVKRLSCEKYVGKSEYDKDPEKYNELLNIQILELNKEIEKIINDGDYNIIEYNQTKFNNFKSLSYGHDGLIEIAYLLFKKYPTLSKIICDKFDYIFIDEYQDAKTNVIEIFMNLLSTEKKIAVCLFGDTMQSIYKDGVGNVSKYTEQNLLKYIPKKDNYRCSEQVLGFINELRFDDIKQKVALKKKSNGELETIEDRQGEFNFLYSLVEKRPTSHSTPEEKVEYLQNVDKLITQATRYIINYRILLLVNKAIASKVGFSKLYRAFDDRYIEVGTQLDEKLHDLQITDLCELCNDYKLKRYNRIIKQIKNNGFQIKKIADKSKITDSINLILSSKASMLNTLETAFELKLIKKSDTYIKYMSKIKQFLDDAHNDKEYEIFKKLYESGKNTYPRIRDDIAPKSEEEYKELESIYKKENFYNVLLSDEIPFVEALCYYEYLNQDPNESVNFSTPFMTMHMTKGSGIDNVLVVMEEYFWNNEYDFSLLFKNEAAQNNKFEASQKLIYVACSRARKNLVCIKLITFDEEEQFLQAFPFAKRITIE